MSEKPVPQYEPQQSREEWTILPLITRAGDAPVPPSPPPRAVIVGLDAAPVWTHVPFIVHGYRVDHAVRDLPRSLFTLHFDTLNIWTHALGLLYFVAIAPFVFSELAKSGAATRDYAFFAGSIIGAVLQMATSVAYHTLRCLSAEAEAKFLRLDIMGVIAQMFGACLLICTQMFRCSIYTAVGYLVAEALLLLTMMYFGYVVSRDTRYSNIYFAVCAVAGGFVVVPCAHALATSPTPASFRLLLALLGQMYGLYFAGFLFIVSRVPERLAQSLFSPVDRLLPGVFNIVNSHAVWHVFVFLGGRSVLEGMLQFNAYTAREGTCPGAV